MTMSDKARRAELRTTLDAMQAAYIARLDELAIDESVSDEEYDEICAAEQSKYTAAHGRVWWQDFALDFPVRRGWIADTFIRSFGMCTSVRLTAKQTSVVARYAVGNDCTWKTGKSFFRISGYLVELSVPRYSNGIGYLTVRAI